MNIILAIIKRELHTYFISPVAYIITSGFLIISSIFFTIYISTSNYAEIGNALNNVAIMLFLFLPFLTMKLFSEEKGSGTFELLQTSPITPLELVLGKYFSALILFIIMLLLSFLFPIYLEIKASPFWPAIFVQYLGIFLVGAAIIGIGLASSSMTGSQIVAGIIGFSISMGLLLISWVGNMTTGFAKTLIQELTIINHLSPFLNGVINIKDVIYYLLWIVFTLFVTNKIIESQSWRS